MKVKLNLLCPVCVLACYVKHTVPIRQTEQLFVYCRDGVTGKALSKKTPCLCECIYQTRLEETHSSLPQSTQSMAMSVTMFSRVKYGSGLVDTLSIDVVLPLGHVRLIF